MTRKQITSYDLNPQYRNYLNNASAEELEAKLAEIKAKCVSDKTTAQYAWEYNTLSAALSNARGLEPRPVEPTGLDVIQDCHDWDFDD